MESQPQNPEFNNKSENFHLCDCSRCLILWYLPSYFGEKIRLDISYESFAGIWFT